MNTTQKKPTLKKMKKNNFTDSCGIFMCCAKSLTRKSKLSKRTRTYGESS